MGSPASHRMVETTLERASRLQRKRETCARWRTRRLIAFRNAGSSVTASPASAVRSVAKEYLLAFSCKTRSFCPSCQAKRAAAFVEWVTGEILQEVPHRQLVWTIPEVLRPTSRGDR